jgi:hypothetical protein
MTSARKKVVIRQLGGELTWGYLSQSGFVEADGGVNIIDPAGRVITIAINKIKTIAYVKDFNLNDSLEPERMGRRVFALRPRVGLWVRLGFLDGDLVEGTVQLDPGLLDAAMEDRGIFLIPPDIRSNTQRLFVPRSAISRLEVVTAVARKPARGAVPEQGGLFGPENGE